MSCRLFAYAIALSFFFFQIVSAQIPLPLNAMKGLSIDRFKYDGFRLLLRQAGLKSQTDLKAVLAAPREHVIVILGRAENLKKLQHHLYDFYHAGGSLMFATDRGDNIVSRQFPIKFSAFQDSRAQFDVEDQYQGFLDCAVVTDLASEHPIFNEVDQLVANRPGYLSQRHKHRDGFILARLPKDASRQQHALIYGLQTRGRFLGIADHSFFVNEMLPHGDNAKFMLNCLAWLSHDGDRKKLLLIKDEAILPQYRLGSALESLPLDEAIRRAGKIPPVGPKITDSSWRTVLNHFLTSLEDKNVHNTAAANQPRGIKHHIFRRIAALFLSITIAALFVRWLIRSQLLWWSPLQFKRFVPSTQKLVTSLSVNEQVRGMRMMTGNFFASFLADQTHDLQSLEPPSVEVELPFAKKAAVRNEILRIWEIATGQTTPKPVAKQFRRLEGRLEFFKALQEEGKLRLRW